MSEIPEDELTWKFVRASGPGGQNVNKVASKAVLGWRYQESAVLGEAAKRRLEQLYPRYVTLDGEVRISSQKYRDQDKNRQDCVEKLHAILVEARKTPTPRRATKPTRGSKLRRLEAKKQRGETKSARRAPREE